MIVILIQTVGVSLIIGAVLTLAQLARDAELEALYFHRYEWIERRTYIEELDR